MNRRSFLEKAGIGTLAFGPLAGTKESKAAVAPEKSGKEDQGTPAPDRFATQHRVTEWAFTSAKAYADPFNDVELDVVFTDPRGEEHRVPAFWAGENVWRVRYSPRAVGRYTYRTISTDPTNPDLHGQQGGLVVSAYTGDNPLRKHGPVRVAGDRLHFEHEDGTPFFWLGDAWYMGLCKRLTWPEDFQTLAEDRVKKGFTVIQIVAGFACDMLPFDARGANEAGYPWEPNYARINPHYFDMADLRIQYLVDRGLMPCIFGCWGFLLAFMGIPKMKQHWRYLIARWGAYPVIWCLAGEGSAPHYLPNARVENPALQKQGGTEVARCGEYKGRRYEGSELLKRGWTEIGRYVRSIDPYHHPITMHPPNTSRDTVEDPTVLDFDMLQTGHADRASIPNTVNELTGELAKTPRMPVLVGEVCFEGMLEASRQEVQRFMFWACMLSGAAGHTYGADGIWQVNTPEQPFGPSGPSPNGTAWGDTPWQTAYQYPGSEQVGIGKELLCRYSWWRFEPHPEWVEPHWTNQDFAWGFPVFPPLTGGWVQPQWCKENYALPYAAGIPGEVRVVFIPPTGEPPKLKNLEPDVAYRAFYFNPATGKRRREVGEVTPDSSGTWRPPIVPTLGDWVLVLERKR